MSTPIERAADDLLDAMPMLDNPEAEHERLSSIVRAVFESIDRSDALVGVARISRARVDSGEVWGWTWEDTVDAVIAWLTSSTPGTTTDPTEES